MRYYIEILFKGAFKPLSYSKVISKKDIEAELDKALTISPDFQARIVALSS